MGITTRIYLYHDPVTATVTIPGKATPVERQFQTIETLREWPDLGPVQGWFERNYMDDLEYWVEIPLPVEYLEELRDALQGVLEESDPAARATLAEDIFPVEFETPTSPYQAGTPDGDSYWATLTGALRDLNDLLEELEHRGKDDPLWDPNLTWQMASR